MAKRRDADVEIEILDYDVSSMGVMSDEQMAMARAMPVPYQPEPLSRQPATWTPAMSPLERLRAIPAPTIEGEGDDGSFAVMAGQALSAGAGGVFEHTSASDRARADGLRLAYYAGAFVVLLIGLALVIFTSWLEAGLLIIGLGCMVAFGSLWVHIASLRHSQAGVNRHKIDTLRGMHKDRLQSRERLARDMSSAWLSLVEKQLDHEQTMEKLRYKHGGK